MGMRVLIACEESQTSMCAFRNLGFEAYSCDIQPCSGGYPQYHYNCDVFDIIDDDWDLIIAHPPCTYLSRVGSRWFLPRYGERALQRYEDQKAAIDFFMRFTNLKCRYVAIENPIGIMSTYYRSPDQIIQPYWFGHKVSKSTCFWLKNLPLLVPTNIVQPELVEIGGRFLDKWYNVDCLKLPSDQRSKARSKTFSGVASAMADQWGNYILSGQYQTTLY